MYPQWRRERISRLFRWRLFSSFILGGDFCPIGFNPVVAHFQLDSGALSNPVRVQAKVGDHPNVLFDQVAWPLDGEDGFFHGHLTLHRRKEDAREVQDVMVDGFRRVTSFLGNDVRRLAFQVGLVADDAFVGHRASQVVGYNG